MTRALDCCLGYCRDRKTRLEEVSMSSRKPTVDGLDDVDDEDGVVEDESSEESDLTLQVESADDAILGDDSSLESANARGEDASRRDEEET
jgi:hypothetical protein